MSNQCNEAFIEIMKTELPSSPIKSALVAFSALTNLTTEGFTKFLQYCCIRTEFDLPFKFCCFLLNPDNFTLLASMQQEVNASHKVKVENNRRKLLRTLRNMLKDQNGSKSCLFLSECVELSGNVVLKGKSQTNESLNKIHQKFRAFTPMKVNVQPDVEADGQVYDRPRDPPGQRSVYIPPGDAAMESYRLSTFMKYPQDTPVNPRHLAAAGFHYTGYKDRVKCFCCGLCVENWVSGDETKAKKWHRNNCELMNGNGGGDQPIAGSFFPFQNGTKRYTEHAADTTHANQTSSSIGRGNNVPMQTAKYVEPVKSATSYQRIELATIASPYHEQLVRSLDLRKETDRSKTYENWPAQNRTVYASDLARSGFFYLGNLDRVQCFSCGGVLRNWNYGDNITAEHRRHFPHCRMVQGTETRNVASPTQPNPQTRTSTQEPPDPTEREKLELSQMFPCQYPVNLHMRNQDMRLATFDQRWQQRALQAKPAQISKAGFYFLGDRDRVKCWYCNGGLQNWDPNDEPWTEHAKWFPTCEFLIRSKGPDFVHAMVAKYPNLPRPILRGPFDVPPSIRRNSESTAPPPIMDHKKEMAEMKTKVKKYMESEEAKSVLEMGFGRKELENVIKKKLSKDGEMFTSVVSIIDAMNEGTDSSDDEMEAEEPQTQTPMSISDLDLSPSMLARVAELEEERKCKVCLDKMADIVFIPCGHLCTCIECASALNKCPICRNKIEKSIRTYLS
ncbi:E3 ubiquitin-protein ligase XIAP-like [Ciona intestinalis]